ncbi:hypothetical protein [Ventosimonas gracilis]|uniref:hypothetical protein n=1 Tax=Ventosimonas gracilis TaxID=1680762 RepID=UPI0013658B72|nr:hypothetical protein [Ventosimonas gracilis]
MRNVENSAAPMPIRTSKACCRLAAEQPKRYQTLNDGHVRLHFHPPFPELASQ